MSEESRVQQLVDEIMDERTPEEVCADFPELLPEVRKRWQQMRRMEAELEALFPTPRPDRGADTPARWNPATELPRIPGYLVEDVVGRGGMGIVYKARQMRLNRTVALKMLIAGVYAGPQERERFLREAQAVAGLRHPNLVQVYDVGDHNGLPYFTMEYVEGGSLAKSLLGTPKCVDYAASLVATLADAVQVAHQGGIIHRDLKPANILLSPNPNVEIRNPKQLPNTTKEENPKPTDRPASDFTPKIVDFGLARHFEGESALTLSGTRVGTPSYMAPEQAMGKTRTVGPAADIYSLGAVLYELVTGRPPFKGETSTETQLQVMHLDPVPPSRLNPRVPRDLETICLKCLQKDPARRYATAAALADDLRRLEEGRPIQARPVGWPERVWRWCRRKPAAAALIATALVSVGLALAGVRRLEQQQAERRAETARHEDRASQAVEARLEQAAILEKEGRWPEARVALEVAPVVLDSPAQASLRERLRQARADADIVAKLEEIRLRLSEGGRSQELSPDKMYGDAFRNYGIPVLTLEPAEAAARLRASSIQETLLAFLHDWLFRLSKEVRGRLRDVLDQADDNDWRRAFRKSLVENDAGELSVLANAPEASAQPPSVLAGLAFAVLGNLYKAEAQEFMRKAQQRYPGDFWINFFLGCFWREDYPQEAVGYFRVAVAIRPRSDGAYLMLGRALRGAGDIEGAMAALRLSFDLHPSSDVAKELALCLAPKGDLEKARAAWEKFLEADPPDHDSWYGYAQLCLFLGNEDAYRRARTALLERFGDTRNDWVVAERTSQACLLLNDSGEELHPAIRLANRAVAEERPKTAVAPRRPHHPNPRPRRRLPGHPQRPAPGSDSLENRTRPGLPTLPGGIEQAARGRAKGISLALGRCRRHPRPHRKSLIDRMGVIGHRVSGLGSGY